jgi:hypothetical protein
MNDTSLQKPTASELQILQVPGNAAGPRCAKSTTRCRKKALGYTTVLKLMQIMTTKGLVRRNEEQRAHVRSGAARGKDQAPICC